MSNEGSRGRGLCEQGRHTKPRWHAKRRSLNLRLTRFFLSPFLRSPALFSPFMLEARSLAARRSSCFATNSSGKEVWLLKTGRIYKQGRRGGGQGQGGERGERGEEAIGREARTAHNALDRPRLLGPRLGPVAKLGEVCVIREPNQYDAASVRCAVKDAGVDLEHSKVVCRGR